jgi:hypothetical protein
VFMEIRRSSSWHAETASEKKGIGVASRRRYREGGSEGDLDAWATCQWQAARGYLTEGEHGAEERLTYRLSLPVPEPPGGVGGELVPSDVDDAGRALVDRDVAVGVHVGQDGACR